jgi:transcription-repair coupling factor (superfamily II helicase)
VRSNAILEFPPFSKGVAALYIANTLNQSGKSLLLVPSYNIGQELLSLLQSYLPNREIFLLEEWGTLPFEMVSPPLEISSARLGALNALANDLPVTVLVTPHGVLQKVIPKDLLQSETLILSVGEKIDREILQEHLDALGYLRLERVVSCGCFSIRSSAIDVFPGNSKWPVRLFFLGNVIHEIKYFDPESQRTLTTKLKNVTILPVLESFLLHCKSFSDKIDDATNLLIKRGLDLEVPARELAHLTGLLKSEVRFPGGESIFPIFAPFTSLFTYTKDVSLIAFDKEAILQECGEILQNLNERHQELVSEHRMVPEINNLYLTYEEVKVALSYVQSNFNSQRSTIPEIGVSGNASLQSVISGARLTLRKEEAGEYDNRPSVEEVLREEIQKIRKEVKSVALLINNDERRERVMRSLSTNSLRSYLEDLPLEYNDTLLTWAKDKDRPEFIIIKSFSAEGFSLLNESVASFNTPFSVITESDLFGNNRPSFRSNGNDSNRSAKGLKRSMSSIITLQNGDYVVHNDYGIGVYQGLKSLTLEGITGDFLHIDYADSTLYLPVQNFAKIHKFSSKDGDTPPIDKLSSGRWEQTKRKVREQVQAIAGELLNLYAARSIAVGHEYEAFSENDELFASTFPYQETPDQIAAIQDVLRDMASSKPMDRLICGDVGFGKTEVALRAAYKCVEERKQVALLVPTTLLVDQHYRNFSARLKPFGVTVEAVSRLFSEAHNTEVANNLIAGKIDVIIGTHKLLSQSFRFSNLGLLIIDEEHRFGVKDKERLKSLKRDIDILTLTATPIPRTLHLSLIGIRDISVIATPPKNRKRVHTFLAARDSHLIRDAIRRELEREGQIFFVYNRIEKIEEVVYEIRELVPNARVEFAHGQMPEALLEKIVDRFVKKKIDVLVSTSIIESGLDIPNANTIIVDNAHLFGIAQLHQLRGRVGRSSTQSYAYYLLPKKKNLTIEAQERLEVLQTLGDLGMGFQMAMRDLEIRGVGSILGKEQSGVALSVGNELYTKLLQEAIGQLNGDYLERGELIEPEIKISIAAAFPASYIPDLSERLLLYQRAATINTALEADDLRLECLDRFGELPKEASSFIDLMELKSVLRRFGIVKLEYVKEYLNFTLSSEAPLNLEKLLALVSKNPEKFSFKRGLNLRVKFYPDKDLKEISELVDSIFLHLLSGEDDKKRGVTQ